MQRIARFLLWGGLALWMGGMATCGFVGMVTVGAKIDDWTRSEELLGAATVGGFWLLVSGVLVLVTGAMLMGVPHLSRPPR